MPRQRRFHVSGGIYHVTLRGNHRERIFHCDSDFQLLEQLLAEVSEDYGLRVHAYCWMPNHIHLALEAGAAPLARPMARLASTYARLLHRRVPTTGHLFERRYFAALVDSSRYLFKLVQYVHLNPVRAGMVIEAGGYRWSSHRAYLGLVDQPWLTTDTVLGMLASDPIAARVAYLEWMARELAVEDVQALWRGDPQRLAPRKEAQGLVTTVGKRSAECFSFEQIVEAVCARFGLASEAFYTSQRRRDVAVARAAVASQAVRHNVCTLSEAARRLRRAPGTICGMIASLRELDPDLLAEIRTIEPNRTSGTNLTERPAPH